MSDFQDRAAAELMADLRRAWAQRDALAEAHRAIAIAPCMTELLGDEIEEGGACWCPGCRSRAALAALEPKP